MMNAVSHRVWCCIVMVAMGIFSVSSIAASASAPVTIQLSSSTEIDGERMRLGDIARVSGSDSGNVEKAKRVEISRAPLVGQSLVVDRNLIMIRLKRGGLNTDRIIVNGSESVTVKRASMEVKPAQIEDAVRRWVSGQLKKKPGNAKIESVKIDRAVTMPKGKLAYRITPLKHIDFEGKFPLPVELLVNGKRERKILAVVSVQNIQDVVVALRPLRRGKILSAEDVGIQEMDVSEFSSNSIRSLEEAIGKRLRRSVEPFDVLRTDLLDLPPVVKRGDVVQIIAESENIKIKTLGIVKARGAHRGERVQVINMDSSRMIYAKVLDAKTVKVEF